MGAKGAYCAPSIRCYRQLPTKSFIPSQTTSTKKSMADTKPVVTVNSLMNQYLEKTGIELTKEQLDAAREGLNDYVKTASNNIDLQKMTLANYDALLKLANKFMKAQGIVVPDMDSCSSIDEQVLHQYDNNGKGVCGCASKTDPCRTEKGPKGALCIPSIRCYKQLPTMKSMKVLAKPLNFGDTIHRDGSVSESML